MVKLYKQYLIQEFDIKSTYQKFIKKIEGDKRIEGDYTEFDNIFVKIIKGGLLGLPIPILGAVPLVSILYVIFSRISDQCSKDCDSYNILKMCYQQCYLDASEKVLSLIKKDLKNINKIEDKELREETRKKLLKELKVWEKRVEKYKKNVENAKKLEDVTKIFTKRKYTT